MTALLAGTDKILAQSGVTIAAPDALFIPTAGTYISQTVTYKVEICSVILLEIDF